MTIPDRPPCMPEVEAIINRLLETAQCRWGDSIGRRFEAEVLSSVRSTVTAWSWDVEAAEGELTRIEASLQAAKYG